MISRCWRHWSNILEMEVRGRLHLLLGIEEWVVGQNVAARCGASGVLGFGARMWCLQAKTLETGEVESGL